MNSSASAGKGERQTKGVRTRFRNANTGEGRSERDG